MKRPLSLLGWKALQFFIRNPTRKFQCHASGLPHVDYWTTAANREVKKLMDAGYFEVVDPQWQNWAINEAGKAAGAVERPVWTPPAPPPLRDSDFALLAEVEAGWHYPRSWVRPLDVGGSGNNDVSARLMVLARHGFVSVVQRGAMSDSPHLAGSNGEVTGDAVCMEPMLISRGRGSRQYRITEAGLQKLAELGQLRAR